MRSKWLTVVLVLSLAVNAGVLATMGYHYYHSATAAPMEPCPMSPGDSHLYQALGLSDLQLSKMEPLARSFHGHLAKLGTAIEEKKESLVKLLSQKDVDPAKIEGLRKEMAGIQDEIQKEVITHIMESKKILDAEQQQRFFDLMSQSMRGKNPWLVKTGGNE
jgi:Spy/CpxP family protein refolding chaperone